MRHELEMNETFNERYIGLMGVGLGCRGWSWLVFVVHDVVGSGVEDLLLVVGEVRRSVRSEQDLSLVHSCQKQPNSQIAQTRLQWSRAS